MAWTIKFNRKAKREFKKLPRPVQQDIRTYLRKRIATAESPRQFGKKLTRNKRGLWRYRVGDYRIICRIEDAQLVVLVVGVGHRKEVYD